MSLKKLIICLFVAGGIGCLLIGINPDPETGEEPENEMNDFIASAGFDHLREANPYTGEIPFNKILPAYYNLKGRGFYKNAGQLKTESETGWHLIDDHFPVLSVTKIAVDPNNTNIFYFCTGEGWFNADAVKGDGVFKSTDGGETWVQLTATADPLFDYCQDIVVHPATSDVYVATRTGGLQRSTDGGETWEKVLGTAAGASRNSVCDIELTADGGVFASIGIFETDGIYFSANGDAGSFEKQTNGFPTSGIFRIELATAPSNENVAYAIPCNSTDYKAKGIWKTTDKGETWFEVNTPDNNLEFVAKQAWYDLSMAVDPNDDNVVAIGGLNIWRTRNGGDTWEQMTSGRLDSNLIRYAHVDQHEIVFQNSDTVYFGCDGGIYRCTNFKDEHPFIYDRNYGYNVTQFYSVSINPIAGNPQVMGGTQDNGTPLAYDDGIAECKFISGGDGAYTAFNSNDPEIMFTGMQERRMFRLIHGGFEIPDTITNQYTTDANVLFINPFELDASDPEVLYQATNIGVWRLNPASVADTNEWQKAVSISGTLTALETTKALPGTVFIGKNSSAGDIYRLDDSYNSDLTDEAVSLDPDNYLPDIPFFGTIYCSSIYADENLGNHLVLTYSNYGVQSIWECEDINVETPVWISDEGNLPDIPVYSAVIHPDNPNVCYIATEMGVFYTDDLNGDLTNWIPCSNFPIVRTDMLKIRMSDRTIVAGTHGRGIWQSALDPTGTNNDITWTERGPINVGGRTRTILIDPNDPSGKTVWAGSIAGGLWKTSDIDAVPVVEIQEENLNLNLFPNPASSSITISFYTNENQQIKIDLMNLNGEMIEEIANENVYGYQSIHYNFKSRLPDGIYFVIMQIGNKKEIRKLIVS